MKKNLKKYLKYASVHHQLTVLRRQPEHMQHVYAVIFAGAVTLLLGAMILYFDYGFWRDRYTRSEVIVEDTTVDTGDPIVSVKSPAEMLEGFFSEAKERVGGITLEPPTFLEGKDTYSKEEPSE